MLHAGLHERRLPHLPHQAHQDRQAQGPQHRAATRRQGSQPQGI